jgi:lipid-A-disaccharide synthase
MDGPQRGIYARLGRPAVSLPNIILGRDVVPELVQDVADAGALTAAIRRLLDEATARQAQISAFGELAELMERGTAEFPRQDPAARVLAHFHAD